MTNTRIITESQFSTELRMIQGREFTAFGQSGYGVIHLLNATDLPERTSFLINPNATASLSKSDGRTELLVVRLTPHLLIETATRLKLYRTGSNLLFRHATTQDQKLDAVFAAIHDEMIEGAAGWREIVHALVNQLTVYLLRSHINLKRSEELELSRVGIVDRRLRRALEFMHDNCGRELSLAEIAAAVYVSEFHFARLFKKITGTTPHACLAAIRIERARKLLAETDLSITEVGARVGYNSQSHFTKIFRAATGLTPNTFRAAAK